MHPEDRIHPSEEERVVPVLELPSAWLRAGELQRCDGRRDRAAGVPLARGNSGESGEALFRDLLDFGIADTNAVNGVVL